MRLEPAANPKTTADAVARVRLLRSALGGFLRGNGAKPIGNKEPVPHGDPSGAKHPFFTRQNYQETGTRGMG